MLRVMTPLWGTKHSSVPVGDKSGGERRAARSLLSCALWRGMGRLWRGMGGMGRPEPLSAHRPRQQQGHSGFHETRDTGLLGAPRGVPSGPARIPRFSRITRHETRITAFYASLPTISHDFPAFPSISRPPHPPGQGSARRSHLQYDRLGFHDTRDTNHGLYRRPVTAFLRVVARHGAAMVRHGRHGAPRAAVRAPSAPATGTFGFSRNTRPETRGPAIARRAARGALWAGANSEVFTSHETRNTNHGLYALFIIVHDCSPLFAIVRYCSLLFSEKYYPGKRRSPQLPSPPGRSRCGQTKMNPC